MPLYHMKSEGFRGTTLYPLNQLKDIYPDIYAEEAAKYEGREHLFTTTVPPLGCLWNDVLFMTAVSPEHIAELRRTFGLDFDWMNFFEIDPSTLDPALTTVWRFDGPGKEMADFDLFDPDRLEPYARIPDATREHYAMRIGIGRRPFIFYGVPHIMYKGTIETSGLPIVPAR